jgi:hypothetical protein
VRHLVHAFFDRRAKFHEDTVHEEVCKARHLRGRVPEQVEFCWHNEHLIDEVAANNQAEGAIADANAGFSFLKVALVQRS